MSTGRRTAPVQTNGPAQNVCLPGEFLVPATDTYSFYQRLCELFPDIHPPHLKQVYEECGKDFLRTIDNVLYARKFRKSLMSQMSKVKCHQRTPPTNEQMTNQHQQNQRQFTHNNTTMQENQPSHSDNLPILTSYLGSGTINTPAAKRSRILAYQATPNHNVHCSWRNSEMSPKQNRALQETSNCSKHPTKKSFSPPPNVYIHPIDIGEPGGGGGDATLNQKPNQNYIFSYRKPTTTPYGMQKQGPINTQPIPSYAADGFTNGTPPSIQMSSGPQQFPFSDWCSKTSSEPKVPKNKSHCVQQFPEKNQHQGVSQGRVSQHPNQNFHFQDEGSLNQQNNGQDSSEWAIILKNTLDPIHSMESTNNSDLTNSEQLEDTEMFDPIGQQAQLNKQVNGNFLFTLPGNSYAVNGVMDESRLDDAVTKPGSCHAPNAINAKNSSLDSQSQQISSTDSTEKIEGIISSSAMHMSPSATIQRSRPKLALQCEKNQLDHSIGHADKCFGIIASEISDDADFSPVNRLMIDAECWGRS